MHSPGNNFKSIIEHIKGVTQTDSNILTGTAKDTTTRNIRDYQNLCEDMCSVIETKLKGEVEVDGTYLSGRTSEKKSYGRVMGRRGVHKEKTLIVAQQRYSQRFSALQTDKHENCQVK